MSAKVKRPRRVNLRKPATSKPTAAVKQVVAPLDVNTFRDNLLSPKKTSAFLDVPVGTLSNWRVKDEGPRYLKVRHAVRYRLSDLERWIAEQNQPIKTQLDAEAVAR